MVKILYLDCETKDPNLRKYGAGWVFKYHYPNYPFTVISVGMILHSGEEVYISVSDMNDLAQLLEIIKNHDTIVCHNALYDLGCLLYLYRHAIDLNKYTVIDTMILAKLYDQHIFEKHMASSPYSLDTLCSVFNLSDKKETSLLTDYAWLSGIYQKARKIAMGRNTFKRPSEKMLKDFCYKDLTVFPSEVLEEYCLQDVRATKSLNEFLLSKLETTDEELKKYSDLLLVCLSCKKNGVRVDLNKAKEIGKSFGQIAEDSMNSLLDIICAKLGSSHYRDINLNSTKQLGPILIELGYSLPLTKLGNPSIGKDWIESQPDNDSLLALLLRYRKALKVNKDFVQKVLKYQDAIPKANRDKDYGWLYPSIKPLGAYHTGRFTSGGGSGCLELSIHQIPRRDEEFGKPLREIFVAHEGEQLVCGDFNGQESRLQVHYASMLACSGTQAIINAWHKDPEMKYHNKVAELTGIDYDSAKMINLALSYGMHNKKLCVKLGLSEREGMALIKKYHQLLPFMQQLQNVTAKTLLKNGYVRTLGSRKLYIDPSYEWQGKVKTQESKALSKLIQGSAADQCIQAMINAYRSGLKVLFSVHDEIVISTKSSFVDLAILKTCMEDTFKLKVPVIADCNIGNSWGEAK